MSWARVDDGWWCHPKVIGLSPAARGLWISALSWSCAQRSEVVPPSLPAMVGCGEAEAAELVEATLWVPVGKGWEIHDWATYQDLSTRERKQRAGRAGGIASGEARRKQARSKAKQTDPATCANSEPDVKQTEGRDEAGSRPVPSQPSNYPLTPFEAAKVRAAAERKEQASRERIAAIASEPFDPSSGLQQIRGLRGVL